ncbi:MAG: hypothetical protein DRH56_10885 [Deltaproteobacteria bacterium]|nr:MAG: hypothetical protein DRH56_10885 [Deltaproteobacteria bacterium]
MAVWPAELPQIPLQEGFSETTPELTIRTSMDAGPEKMRRRFTAGSRAIKINMNMADAQVLIFDEFYLANCASRFDYADPRTQITKEFRFMGQPVYTQIKSLMWRVSFALEQVP